MSAPAPERTPPVHQNRVGVDLEDAASQAEGGVAGRAEARGRLQRAAVEGHVAARCAEVSVGGDLQDAGVEEGPAGIAVGTGQDRRSRTGLRHRSRPADDPGEALDAAAVEDQRAIVGDVADDAAAGAAIAELQRAATDHGAAGVGVGAGQDRRSGASLRHRSRPADDAAEVQRIAAVEDQRTVIGDVADDAAAGAAIAELQRAAADHRAARIAVGARQDQRARIGLQQAGRAGNLGADIDRCARIDANERHAAVRQGHHRQRRARTGHLIAVGDELQPHCADRLGDGHDARRAREDADAGNPALVDAAGRVGPIAGAIIPASRAAVDAAVAGRVGAVPELHGNAF